MSKQILAQITFIAKGNEPWRYVYVMIRRDYAKLEKTFTWSHSSLSPQKVDTTCHWKATNPRRLSIVLFFL